MPRRSKTRILRELDNRCTYCFREFHTEVYKEKVGWKRLYVVWTDFTPACQICHGFLTEANLKPDDDIAYYISEQWKAEGWSDVEVKTDQPMTAAEDLRGTFFCEECDQMKPNNERSPHSGFSCVGCYDRLALRGT
jgi:hypothetical protein